MAFHDTTKNNGYHSLFKKLFGHVYGGRFFPDTVHSDLLTTNCTIFISLLYMRHHQG